MKIAVISPNASHLQEMAKVLQAGSHTPILIEGGKSKMRDTAEDEHPDIMIVEGMCCDISELSQVEYVTTRFPSIAVVLVCSTSTPDFLINSMRAGVREVLPSPPPPAALHAAINRLAVKMQGHPTATHGKVLAFIPCKGGSGATFIATNLGSQLGESKSVLLIDLNLQFGDALACVYEGKPASTIADVAREIRRLDHSFLASSAVRVTPNFSILAAPEKPSQAIEVKPEHVEAIISLAVRHYDYVLLDMSRHIDTLAVKSLDRADSLFPVLQAGVPALRNARKLLDIFKSLGYDREKIEIVINRFERSSDIGLSEIERSLGAFPMHTVSNSYKPVTAAINHGGPLSSEARNNPVTRNLAEFARELEPRPNEQRNLMSRLFGRSAA